MDSLLTRAFEILRKNPMVPAFSPSAREFLTLSQKPNPSFEALLKVVEIDPGLTAQFLKLANSPVYQRGETTSSLREALLRLGMEEAFKTGLMLSIVNSLRSVKSTGDPFQFWLHSLLTARICARFASKYQVSVEKVYLAGLLHDVGIIFLEHYFPKEFHELEQSSEELMYESEKHLFDTNHAEIGYALTSIWGLDDEISRAIYFHHKPSALRIEDPARNLAECVGWSGEMACLARAYFDRKMDDPEYIFLAEEYGVTHQVISELIARAS
jgi:putative nucleotidyltransferase with HDIG domain